ncbi:transketolase [Spiroplasma endosymbiont of Crioceris asparagi]|uniref:transketolase n=1 Tax=Spiroplasma endosymbiont of Crioceris asparagi TaxID=3066286 RepID=UPI0030D392CD
MDLKNITALKILGIDAINKANSGHPGIVLGAAPIIYALLKDHLNITPKNSKWINRDRFVLSAGHGSALLYSTLHLSGFNISIEDLKNFRQLNSKTPGHPEYKHTDGVECTTGPLGQGIGMGVGMAVAEAHLSSKYNKIIDHYTYVLCGDGDLQEGLSYEAISFAGRQKLNKLILLHDSNNIQLDSPVKDVQTEDLHKRFEASNWNTILVKNGDDWKAISKAIGEAKLANKPTYIEVKTVIGAGATNEGTTKVHGAPLGKDIETVKKNLNWTNAEFEIEKDVYNSYSQIMNEKEVKYLEWHKQFNSLDEKIKNEITNNFNQKWDVDKKDIMKLIKGETQATRVSSGNVMNYLTAKLPMIGGSADLCESTKIKGPDGNFDIDNRSGRNIMYGVREFAMASINNGVALHGGLLPFAAGFFVFSDYMKPAIRLSALQQIQTLYVFTHDSIGVGEDGPTHQPIEQLAMLRAIPNLKVFRPADMHETIAAYIAALEYKNGPSVIVCTRQNLEELNHGKDFIKDVKKGAYIISEDKNSNVTIIATGSEVKLALDVKNKLNNENINAKVVSMPCVENYEEQSLGYKDAIIDKNSNIFTIELGTTFGWEKYSFRNGKSFGWNKFGFSAPFGDILKHIGFNAETISKEIIEKLRGNK